MVIWGQSSRCRVVLWEGVSSITGAEKRIYKSLQNCLLQQQKFGQSKHAAKSEAREKYMAEHGTLKGYNPSKVDGIYSIKTMETYITQMRYFSRYCVAVGAKRLGDLSQRMAEEYLVKMHKDGKSPWTISTASSAINKALGYNLSPSKLGLPLRTKDKIKRSRGMAMDEGRDFRAYSDQIIFARSSGVRRMSVTTVRPTDFVTKDGQVAGVRVKEKGGKVRIAPILATYRDAVTHIVQRAIERSGEDAPVFDKYDKHIDNHRYRAQYAADLLRQLEAERADGTPQFGGAYNINDYCRLRGRDRRRKAKTQGHDTDILGAVSGSLGHNRIQVVLTSYSYLY